MSDQSQGGARPLKISEELLIRALLAGVDGNDKLVAQLDGLLVHDMDDGGMGSLKFAGDERRTLGRCLVEAEFVDCDGLLVSVVLNADACGQLYELDMWKVDFSPLQKYPAFESLTVKA